MPVRAIGRYGVMRTSALRRRETMAMAAASSGSRVAQNVTICAAIRSRSVVRFFYGGTLRIVEPYVHGVSRAGNEVFRGYQVAGRGGRSNVGWRLFDLSKISGLQRAGMKISVNREDYTREDPAMKEIHCAI